MANTPSVAGRQLNGTVAGFLARGGKCVTFEGDEFPRNVLIEFPSLDQSRVMQKTPAQVCSNSSL